MSQGKNRDGLENGLEELIREAKGEPEATGIRIFTQYCLEQEQKPGGFYTIIVPRILCQSMSDKGQVFGQYEREFAPYYPIETKTTPEKIQGIGAKVENDALEIADHVRSSGLKVISYRQSPPRVI